MTVYLCDHPCTPQLIIEVHVVTLVSKLYILIITVAFDMLYLHRSSVIDCL